MTKTSFNGNTTNQTVFSSLNVGSLTGSTSVTINGNTLVTAGALCTTTTGVFEESVDRTGCYYNSITYVQGFPGDFIIFPIVSPASGVYDAGSNRVKVPSLGVYHIYWQSAGNSGITYNRLNARFNMGADSDALFQYIGNTNGGIRTADMGFQWNLNLNFPFPINSVFMTVIANVSDFAVTNCTATIRIVRIKAHA